MRQYTLVALAPLLAAFLYARSQSSASIPVVRSGSASMASIKLIITGPTGTAGSEVLRQALLHPKVERVTVLTRRALPPHVPQTHDKLTVVVHKDYLSYPPELLEQVGGYDGVIWAQGLSAVGMKEDAYSVITHDYPLAAAKAFATLKKPGERPFIFAYLSGEGTKQSGKSYQLFARVKGRAEVALAQLQTSYPTLKTYSFRPAGIIPVEPVPEAGRFHRYIPALASLLRYVMPTHLIATPDLANGMIEAVIRAREETGLGERWKGKGQEGDRNTFSNEEIKQLAKEGGFTTQY